MSKKSLVPTAYMMLYITLFILELFYISLVWSSYGDPEGRFKNLYLSIKRNTKAYVFFGLIFLVFLSILFPGIGFLAFVITLWRVADMCCRKVEGFGDVIEEFGDGLLYGWGRYYPDSATFFNQGHLQRDQDGTRAAYSSAVGDVKDRYWLAKLAEYENKIVHLPIHAMRRKEFVYEKDGCGYGKYIIPKLKDVSVVSRQDFLCNEGCDRCSIQQYGNFFEAFNRPRPLYTTSTLAKEVGSA